MNLISLILGITLLSFLGFYILAFIYIAVNNEKIQAKMDEHNKEKQRLSDEYNTALQSDNKVAALNAGRKYKAHVRGYLSLTDEVAIMNDINTMK